jgi:hypothetical protein
MALARWLEVVRRLSPVARRRSGRRLEGRPPPSGPRLEALEERLAPAVTLSVSSPAPFSKPDSGQVLGVFLVTRSGDPAPAVQVDYATQDGAGTNGAHAGTDYAATSGTLQFAPNQTTAAIAVPILGNNIFQADKTFTVSLSNPQPDLVGFASQQTFATGNQPYSVAVADLNGDGKPDLVVANRGSSTVSVLLNTTPAGATAPTFAAQQTFAVVGIPRGWRWGTSTATASPTSPWPTTAPTWCRCS